MLPNKTNVLKHSPHKDNIRLMNPGFDHAMLWIHADSSGILAEETKNTTTKATFMFSILENR